MREYIVMPPENKNIVTKLAEITCKNCLFSNNHWQNETVKCRRDLSSEKDDFCTISNVNFFCSHGMWRIVVAAGRPSVVDFQVAYDYVCDK